MNYTVIVKDRDSIRYYKNGLLHREDGPAVEYANSTKYWHNNGKIHREDGPAIECVNGDKFWYKNGQRHREDGPAIVYASGNKYWYLFDKMVDDQDEKKRLALRSMEDGTALTTGEIVHQLLERLQKHVEQVLQDIKDIRSGKKKLDSVKK